MRKSFIAVGAAAASALLLAACGGGGSSTSSSAAPSSSSAPAPTSSSAPAPTSSSAPAPTTSEAKPAWQEAADLVPSYTSNPTSIIIDVPLSKEAPKGIKVASITNNTALALALQAGVTEAGGILGWDVKNITSALDPESTIAAMQEAIDWGANAITISGVEKDAIADQLKQCADKGIYVVTTAAMSAPGDGFTDTSIAGQKQLDEWGKMVAAYVVGTTQGGANIANYQLTMYPILVQFDKSFTANVGTWCPECKIAAFPQQLADIGTKTPAAVVANMQADPAINYNVYDLGALMIGVDPALKEAGLEAGGAGLTADATTIQGIKDGTQDAWTGYPLAIVGFRAIDSIARLEIGDALQTDALLPTQLVTPDNVNDIVLDKDGNYVGVKDYAAQFKALWLVK